METDDAGCCSLRLTDDDRRCMYWVCVCVCVLCDVHFDKYGIELGQRMHVNFHPMNDGKMHVHGKTETKSVHTEWKPNRRRNNGVESYVYLFFITKCVEHWKAQASSWKHRRKIILAMNSTERHADASHQCMCKIPKALFSRMNDRLNEHSISISHSHTNITHTHTHSSETFHYFWWWLLLCCAVLWLLFC